MENPNQTSTHEVEKEKITRLRNRYVIRIRLTLLIMSALSLLLYSYYVGKNKDLDIYVTIAMVVSAVAVFGYLFLTYLNPEKFQLAPNPTNVISQQEHLQKMNKALEELIAMTITGLSKKSNDINESDANTHLQSETRTFQDKGIDQLDKDLKRDRSSITSTAKDIEKYLENNKIVPINNYLYEINFRLSGEINRMVRNANINLLLGSGASISGIVFLGYDYLFLKQPANSEALLFFQHYLPKLTMILFVEFFAFFFLRNYKLNQNDIKHFHNEKTNIDLRIIALRTALLSENKETIDYILRAYSGTERNVILSKEQTTIEIEKEKLDQLINKGVSEKMAEFFKMFNGQSKDSSVK